MFAALFEAKATAAPPPKKKKAADGPVAKKKAKVAVPSGEPTTAPKAAGAASRPHKKGKATPSAAAAPSGLSKKQRRKQRQRERKAGAEAAEPAAAAAGSSTVMSSTKEQTAGGSALQRKMAAQLAGAHFRRINEELYTTPSAEAVELFRKQPEFFELYHDGFRSQAAHWPVRPVDVLVRWLDEQPASWVVGDLGCGDAQIAASVRQDVHSFDLVANNPRVTACDIARVPLAGGTLDVAIFCLALMGTNYVDFLREAHRLLKPRGLLKIAEVPPPPPSPPPPPTALQTGHD